MYHNLVCKKISETMPKARAKQRDIIPTERILPKVNHSGYDAIRKRNKTLDPIMYYFQSNGIFPK